MARTKASVGAKVSSGKSSKAAKVSAPPPVVSSRPGKSERSSKALGSGGGNPACPRETPSWQKPITNFFISRPREQNDDDTTGATTSKPTSRRPIIESSDEESSPEKPKNTVLDESITLEPLTGENSHKLDEYYPKNGEKGKGVGKKTKGKENGVNGVKRGRDENENEENLSKKIKV